MLLQDERISLVPAGREHASLLYDWLNSEQAASIFFVHWPGANREDIESIIGTWGYKEYGKVVSFIIHSRDNSEPIGLVQLLEIDWKNRQCFVGVLLGDSQSSKRGIGSSARTMAVRYAHSELGIHKVWSRTLAGNEAAIKSLQRSGFSQEAMLSEMVYKNGRFQDVIVFSHTMTGGNG